ncbi:MAG: YihA family ribosome biogenesis GTP-binding protein [Solobacterium sp.]|nr:YihA family ribosome biogenesis GTP-binding protein [Solobacterium sp.]
MEYHEAKLLASAAHKDQWPNSNLPEVIFVGRSNAGKSTLINALVNRKNLAYSGKTPGKTRLLNFFAIDQKYIFTDAPGYGYATKEYEASLKFGRLMETYFHERQNLKGLILVLDARRDPSEDDLSMIEYAKAMHLAILIVCTKADKLSKNALHNQIFKIAQKLDIPKTAFYPVSSLQKEGLNDVWKAIQEITLK